MRWRVWLVVAASLALLVVAPRLGALPPGEAGRFVLWQLRVPRVLMGIEVGAVLALAGGVFQALFSNPLATPSTTGTTAGATLGALAVVVLGVPASLATMPWIIAAAFVGGLTASLLVALAAASGRARLDDVLLAGIAVTLVASSLATALQFVADAHALFAATHWAMGHLPQVGYDGVVSLLPLASVSVFGLLLLTRPLQVLVLGQELAQARGVSVRRVRVAALLLASLGVAGVVAWCGPIAFVGLIVPHAIRLLVGAELRRWLPLSTVAGAAFLVGCDTLGRLLVAPTELPVGVTTAALGAPVLVGLVARRRRGGGR